MGGGCVYKAKVTKTYRKENTEDIVSILKQ